MAAPSFAVLLAMVPLRSGATQGNVRTTVHNLSSSGPGEIRALTEKQVCRFCHVPHSAVVPVPLWSRRLSDARYVTATLRRGRTDEQLAPQPDGSSRLCLSCHDGTIALGELAGQSRPINMAGGGFLGPGTTGYIGTDISGSHPISFVVLDGPRTTEAQDGDMGLKPLSTLRDDPDVRLDSEGKMQCTTCHNPHSDSFYSPGKVPRFWNKPTVEEVCLTCHVPN